jgi:hypothetical protein
MCDCHAYVSVFSFSKFGLECLKSSLTKEQITHAKRDAL